MNLPDYQFTNHYKTVEGLKIHYIDEGPRNAQPVVMVHGNPSWSFYFRKLVSALCGNHRCIVPDHVGMGLSDKPGNQDYPHTLERRIYDLESLLEQLDINRDITFIVHDWGGMIGMAYAVRHPQQVSKLVIMNTAAFHLPNVNGLPWQLALARHSWMGPLLVQGFNAFCRGAVKKCVARKTLSAEVKQAYLAPYNSWHNRLAVLRFVQDIPLHCNDPGYNLVAEIGQGIHRLVKTPALICWGMQDFVFDKRFLDEWTKRLPHAEVYRFDDSGHYVLEDAAEEIVPLVQAFLTRTHV